MPGTFFYYSTMKKTIVTFALLLAVVHLQAQTANETKALNLQVELNNALVKALQEEMPCITDFYSRIQQRRKQPSVYLSYDCRIRRPDYEIQQARNARNSLPTAYGKELAATLDQMLQTFDQTVALFQRIESYVLLKDYEKDNYMLADSLIRSISEKYSTINTLGGQAYGWITAYNPPPANTNDTEVANRMAALMGYLLDEDAKLLNMFTFNAEKDNASGRMPAEALIKNINLTDNMLHGWENLETTHPLRHWFRSFAGVQSNEMQAMKRNALDDYLSGLEPGDAAANSFYRDMLNYVNNSQVIWYNSFADEMSASGKPVVKRMAYCPRFGFEEPALNPRREKVVWNARDFGFSPPPPSDSPMTAELGMALNNYVDFLNTATHRVSVLSGNLYGYYSTAKRYAATDWKTENRDGILKYTVPDFIKIPHAQYHRAINDSRFIPEPYRANLNQWLASLYGLIGEMISVSHELADYTGNKTYKTDNFAWYKKRYAEFCRLYLRYDSEQDAFHAYLHQVYDAFPKSTAENNAWYRAGFLLEKMVTIDYKWLMAAHRFYQGEELQKYDPEPLVSLVRQSIENKYTIMDGLKLIGRNHGHCPYTPYDDVPLDSKRLTDNILAIDPAIEVKDAPKAYHNVLYIYNDIVRDYNKFVWLANGGYETFRSHTQPPAWLLMALSQPEMLQLPTEPLPNDLPANDERHDADTAFVPTLEGFAPNNLIFLLDVSGSMYAEDRLPLLKKSMKTLIGLMRTTDQISIVLYSGKASVAVNAAGSDQPDLISTIDGLKSGGETNINAGIKLAYKTARENYKTDGNNRIILATDGRFRVTGGIRSAVIKGHEKDIALSVFVFGKAGLVYPDLNELAETGGGNYKNITPANADKQLILEAQGK